MSGPLALLIVFSGLPGINAYNLTRSHSGIGGLTPWARVNNLLGNDS